MATPNFVILFFGISPGELFIILLVVLVLFGPRKIPEIAKTLGRGYSELKKAQRDLNMEIENYTGDIEKEADKFQKEVKSVVDDADKKSCSNFANDNEKRPLEKEREKDPSQTEIDDDDLPYPYNKNKNLKA